MRGFTRSADTAVAHLDAEERVAVTHLIEEVAALLIPGPDHGTGVEPEDPAVLRLLPNAAPTEPAVAEEYRRLTERDLRSLKEDRLLNLKKRLDDEGPEWVVRLDDALPVAAALTDVRLVLATRLGLKTDEDAEWLHDELDLANGLIEHGAPEGLGVDMRRMWLMTLYQALTWLQDSLIACVMDEEGDDDE